MMKNSLTISIRDLNIKITTDYPRYYEYLINHFKRVICESRADPDIVIDASWQKSLSNVALTDDAVSIGANTILSDRHVVTSRKIGRKKKVRFAFSLKDKTLFVEALSQFKPFKDTFRYTLLHTPQDNFFFELTYPVVYYPVFWYLEYFHNTHVLHAAGVKIKDRAVVINGLEGVGKTTLSLVLAKETKGTFLSDNLIFYDDAKIYACYEPVRLHKTQDSSLWDWNFRKINKFRTMKDFYEPIRDVYSQGISPSVFLTVGFNNKFMIREVPKETIIDLGLNFCNLVQELNNYNEYASLLNLMVKNSQIVTSRSSALSRLLHNVRCFEIGMDRSLGPYGNFEKMKGELLK
jgi:hypothetical protein